MRPLLFLALCTVSTELYARMDITMLDVMEEHSTVAFYSYAQKIVNLIVIALIAITAVFLPRLSYYYQNDRDKFNKLTKFGTDTMIFISIPSFVLISFILRIFCYGLNWLPSSWPADTAPASARAQGYIIPVFCLSFGSICGYCRFTRAELCEVMESDYLLLARTKGLTRRQAITRHALKNAMVPIFPAILAEFIGILGGSIILESLYGIPGIGKLFILCLKHKDYDILFVDMAIFTTISLVAGIVLDLSYGFIDPRIRMGER